MFAFCGLPFFGELALLKEYPRGITVIPLSVTVKPADLSLTGLNPMFAPSGIEIFLSTITRLSRTSRPMRTSPIKTDSSILVPELTQLEKPTIELATDAEVRTEPGQTIEFRS